MESSAKELLYDLLQTPSPTGHEQAVQRKIRDRFRGIADVIEPDVHGNLVLGINTNASKKVMLAGHCDQIGFLVKYVSPDGYIYLDTLGGNDYGVILGEHLVVHTRSGPVTGVVGRKPVHLQQGPEVQQIPAASKIWLDIGAANKDEVLETIRIGDYATFRTGITELRNNLIASPGLDNTAGLVVCLEVLRRCKATRCEVALYVAST